MGIASIAIQREEYQKRADILLEYLRKEEINGVVLFDRDYILYFTGFAFIPTERPIAFAMSVDGEKLLFVPFLEKSHGLQMETVDKVVDYVEYPYHQHPMNVLVDVLQRIGINRRIGVDNDGYPWILGYRGPKISEVSGWEVVPVRAQIEDQMMIKSEIEINLIKESVKWGNLAHTLLQRYTRVGVTETEVSLRASNEATLCMLDAIGPIYQAQSFLSSGAHAGYRGQIGRNAAIPHALANNITFEKGDVLVTGANAPVWSYNSELERTMIIGKPSDDQIKYFYHMVALQDIAINAIKPGRKCSEIDRIVRDYYEKHNLMDYWLHHVGHAIGIRYHESPYFDIGDDTVIKQGMVFTVEPGLYIPTIGGFRHSDTVLVTDTGVELLTYYPRDLASLTIQA